MFNSDSRDSIPNESQTTNAGNPKAEGESFWKQKIGGGAILMWLIISFLIKAPRAIDKMNREAPRQQIQQAPPDMAKLQSMLRGITEQRGPQIQKQIDEKTIADATEAIRLNPDDANAYHNRGLAWLRQHVDQQALADFDEAIRLNPTDSRLFGLRALLRTRFEDYPEAIADYSAAIELDPNNVRAHNGIAWLYATCPEPKFRNGEQAVATATKACELTEWKDAAILDTLAAAYAESGDFDSAVKWQTKAVEMSRRALKPKLNSHLELYQSGKSLQQRPQE